MVKVVGGAPAGAEIVGADPMAVDTDGNTVAVIVPFFGVVVVVFLALFVGVATGVFAWAGRAPNVMAVTKIRAKCLPSCLRLYAAKFGFMNFILTPAFCVETDSSKALECERVGSENRAVNQSHNGALSHDEIFE
jgi:hypothetical protein